MAKIPYEGVGGMMITHPCIIYDVATKTPIATFPTIKECAQYLGILPQRVTNIIRSKGKSKTNRLGKIITIRTKPINHADINISQDTTGELVHSTP